MNLEDKIIDLSNNMRVHGAILIIGAGASYEMGLPLYAQFPEMLWRIIDEFPHIKMEMGYPLNKFAKECIETDTEKIKKVFDYLEKDDNAIYKFKKQFKSVNDDHNKNRSSVHDGICKLIHEGFIKLVISLNWDDLLECAWERLYGTKINGDKMQLIKPHGDVRNLDERWVFPNKPGFISEKELKIICDIINNRAVSVIILGYSEGDKVIADKVIKPNESICKTYRISPVADDSIKMNASLAIQSITSYLYTVQNNLWERIDFLNQVGIERALLGYRLLPADVTACARFPQIEIAKDYLERLNYVIIQSEPGCGKSITAYQIAFDLNKEGWEVLKFRNDRLNEDEDIMLPGTNYKTVYIIDDAQQLLESTINKFISSANSRIRVIITRTLSNGYENESIIISKIQAIESLKKHYLSCEDEIVPILNKIRKDDKIGNLYLQTPLKYIIKEAEKEGNPWLFNYSLCGGWNSIKERYTLIKERNRSDITIVLIATKQIFELDKLVELEWIYLSGQKWGKSINDCINDIEYLLNQKLILKDGGVRTLHLQLASRIIMRFFSEADENERKKYIMFIQDEMLMKKTSLLGITWFTNLTFAYEISHYFHHKIYDDNLCENLLRKCFNQQSSEERRNAGYVIDLIVRNSKKYTYKELCCYYAKELKDFVENTDNLTIWSNRDILNSMYNENNKEKIKFVNQLNVDSIFENMKKIDSDSLYGWADFLSRFTIGQSKRYRNVLSMLLPRKEISEVFKSIQDNKIFSLCEMLSVLEWIDEEYAYKEYYLSLPIIQKAMKKNFTETLSDIDYHYRAIYWGEGLFEIKRKTTKQQEALIAFCKLIEPTWISKAITNGKPRDWNIIYRFISELIFCDEEKLKTAIKEINFEILNKSTEGLWEEQPDDLLMLIEILGIYDLENTNILINNHIKELKFMRVPLIIYATNVAEELVKCGKKVNLIEKYINCWDEAIHSIKMLNKKDKKLCMSIIDQNYEDIKEEFIKAEPLHWEEFSNLILEIKKVYPDFLIKLICDIELKDIIASWKDKLYKDCHEHNRNKKSIRGFKKLINSITDLTQNEDFNSFLKYTYDKIEKTEQQNAKYKLLTVKLDF